jgi:hypothetical protein
MMLSMRTTITLEPEVAELVERAMRERKLPFKRIVNDAILAGLAPQARPKVLLPTHRMGPPLTNLDKATQLAGDLEDAEVLRKMTMGK